MKRQKCKLLCLLVAVVISATYLFASAPVSANDGNAETNTVRAVISSNLTDVLKTASADDLIPVSIWITEADIDAVEQAALKETGLNKELIAELYADGVQLSSKEIDAYIEAERRIYAEVQSAISEQFLQRALGTSSMDTPLIERDTYVSKYAPSIWTELTKSEINVISGNSEVNCIYYSPKNEYTVEDIQQSESTNDITYTIAEALSALRVPYVRDTLGYTGEGIKIGQIEAYVPDVTASYLTGADITCRPGDTINFFHPSQVAGIMVSHEASNMGIVPDASLYSAAAGDTIDFYDAVEWLLDQNVNIINMSGLCGSRFGYYEETDRFVDHIAINHSVHFVSASGNDSDIIPNPGMAYNSITVGSANANLNGRGTKSAWSSQEVLWLGNPLADKPDILAIGENILLFGIYSPQSGTSFAAPMVTGIAAQMMQANPMLKTCQDSLKACLLASINNSTLRFVPSNTSPEGSFNSYNTCGAGLVDAQSSVYTARNGRFTVNQYFPAGSSTNTVKTTTFTVSSTDSLMRVALNWLQHEKYTSNDHISGSHTSGNYVDMNLHVYDPNGNLVGSSTVTYGNVEIVQFTPTMTGTYTVRVTIANSNTEKAYFSVAWW